MRNFKLKELVAVSCLISLVACGGLEEEIGDNDSPGGSAGEPTIGEPETGAPIVSIPEPVIIDPVVIGPVIIDPVVVDPVVGQPLPAKGFEFQLIDRDENFVMSLNDGDVLDMNTLPEFFNIEAVSISDEFLSVKMKAEGTGGYKIDRIEEAPVWTLNSSSKGFKGGAGAYEISATGYIFDAAQGSVGAQTSITIVFQDQALSNQRPVAANDNAVTSMGVTLSGFDVLANDSDADQDPLVIQSAEASDGEVLITGGFLSYSPPDGFTGEATITYEISDGSLTDSATLIVNVVEPSSGLSLQWDRPATFEDGSPLASSNLAGYEILYRAVGQIAYQKHYVENGASLTADISDLGSGELELTIAAISVDGFYSAFSTPIRVNI